MQNYDGAEKNGFTTCAWSNDCCSAPLIAQSKFGHALTTTGVLQTSSPAYLSHLNLCPFNRPAQQHWAVAPGLGWSRGPGLSVVSPSCHLLQTSTASPGPSSSLRNATLSPTIHHTGTIHSLNCPCLLVSTGSAKLPVSFAVFSICWQACPAYVKLNSPGFLTEATSQYCPSRHHIL